MEKRNQAAFGGILLLILGMVLSGAVYSPDPITFLADTCKDGIDNDGEFPSSNDMADQECTWMPMDFGNGEYDGAGINPPSPSEVAAYVATWNTMEGYPSHWEVVKAGYDEAGSNPCVSSVQDSLIEYRDTYGLLDDQTGVSEHQSHCGVSY